MIDLKADNIDVDMIYLIHRNDDGYIGFVRKPNPNRKVMRKDGKPKNFETLFSVKTKELKNIFPEFASWLLMDSYFTINAFFRPAWWRNALTGLQDVERRESNLRYISACYVDLDVGRPDSENPAQRLSFPHASYLIQLLTEHREIPAPSIIANSGRGVYLLWLLRDENISGPPIPPMAWPEKVLIYKQINKKLGERLINLAWDNRAFDASRVLRVPGSYHFKAQRMVKYQVQFGQDGKVFFYTLRELADFSGVSYLEKPNLPGLTESTESTDFQLYRKTKNKGSRPRNKNGFLALNNSRIQDLLTLEQYQGGFPHGCRRRRLTIYAEFLRKAGYNEGKTMEALQVMALNCKPPYPSEENDTPLETIVKNVFSRKKGACRNWKNEKLCLELGITVYLARELELITILPEEITAERKKQPKREVDRQRRQEAIYSLLLIDFHASIRMIKNELNDQGINASIGTLQKEIPFIKDKIQAERMQEKKLLKAS